jgi:hypothetical protein
MIIFLLSIRRQYFKPVGLRGIECPQLAGLQFEVKDPEFFMGFRVERPFHFSDQGKVIQVHAFHVFYDLVGHQVRQGTSKEDALTHHLMIFSG